MSFWEDRFINRPHASAVPDHLQADVQGWDSAGTNEPVVGRAWSIVPEPAAEVAHDEPVETELSEIEAVEYKRRGLFRRRRPVAVNGEVSDSADEMTEPGFEENGAFVENGADANGNGRPWAIVESSDDVEPVVDVELEESDPEPVDDNEPEDEIAASVEYRRRGLFRRRRPEPVATAFEEQPEEAGAPQPELAEVGFNGNGHSLARVEPAEETAAEFIHEETEAEPADEVEPDDEIAAPVEHRRHGFFRRRKSAPVANALEEQSEEMEISEPEYGEIALNGNSYSWAVVESVDEDIAEPAAVEEIEETEIETVDPGRRGFFRRRTPQPVVDETTFEVEAADVEPADEDELEDEIAAPIKVAKRRRGLFRRHRPEPDAGLEDADFDEGAADAAETISVTPESIEDDAFANVPYYAYPIEISAPHENPYAHDDGWNVEDSDAGAEEFVMSEADEPEEVPAEESATDAASETDSDAGPTLDDQFATEAPESEPTFEAAPEPPFEPAFESETYAPDPAAEAEPETSVPTAESETQTEPDLEPETEAQPEPELEPEFQAEVEPEVEPEPEVSAFEPVPTPLQKRNGGGSGRGKKVVGLKVGASQIAAAVVTGNADRPALVDLARRPLEPGVVVDGELRDPEALARALKTFFKDHGLPAKNVRLGLSSSRVGVRTFDIAGIEDEERFDNAVRFKAHEVLPVAAHESVLDYRVVEERYMENGEISRRVLLVVAPRDQVTPYIEACQAAGLRLAGVDLEAFGLLRAFVPPLGTRSRSEDSATVVAAIGHEASTLLVAGGGVCEFTRVFDWGGGALQAAIADELDVPLMEAATILTHLSLSGPGRHLDSLDSDTRSRALEAVRTRLMPFARELVSSLQFYQTQPESLGIREILITGGTSHLEGLADALHQMIGVNVSVGDPLGRVDVQTEIPVALDATIGSMAVPIGLAIEDDAARSVNLLPKDARQGRKRPNVLAVAAPLAAVVPLAALALLFVQANGAAGDRQAELDAVQAQIAALPEPTRPNIDPSLAGEQAQRATAVAQILGGRLSWERVLGDITRVLPAGVSLTELTATAPQPTTPEVAPPTTTDTASTTPTTPPPAPAAPAPTTPTGVTVIGYALDYATVARALARIQAVPSLTNAQLQSATPGTIGKKRTIEFTIVADLAIPGGAQ